VHHVGILYDQFMMHGQRNIKLCISFIILIFQTRPMLVPVVSWRTETWE